MTTLLSEVVKMRAQRQRRKIIGHLSEGSLPHQDWCAYLIGAGDEHLTSSGVKLRQYSNITR